jgi:hypothetical protein
MKSLTLKTYTDKNMQKKRRIICSAQCCLITGTNLLKYHEQNDLQEMNFYLESQVNVLNPMAELNHNTDCTFNMKSHVAKCSNFSNFKSRSYGFLVFVPINSSWPGNWAGSCSDPLDDPIPQLIPVRRGRRAGQRSIVQLM